MDAYALFDALTDVRDGFLEETERRLHGKKRRRVGVYLLAAVLIVLLCFSSAVALDADFRQRVLSLFQVAEVVPTQTSRSVTLADGLQADYVFVPAYARTEGGMFIVCTDEVEMKQGSHYAAYAYENGQLVLQENHRFDQTYTVQGKTCRLMFDWAEHDGRAAITWAPTLDEAERLSPGLWEWRLEGGPTTQYRVKLGSWPVTIDLRTGALTDPLASYDTSQFPEDTFVETWPDEQGRCLLAQLVSTSPYRLTRYYFDGTDVTPLAQLCGGEPSHAYLTGNMLVYWQWEDDAPASGCALRVADRSGYHGAAAGVYGYPRHRHVCRRGRAGGRRNSAGGSSAGRRLSADTGDDFRRLGPSGAENGGGQDGHPHRHPDLPQYPCGGVYAAGYAAGGYLVLRQSRRDVAAGGGA